MMSSFTSDQMPISSYSAATPKLQQNVLTALGQRLELHPAHRRMHWTETGEDPEPAIAPGEDPFAADHLGVAHDTLHHHFRMLHKVAGGLHHPRHQDLIRPAAYATSTLPTRARAADSRLPAETLWAWLSG